MSPTGVKPHANGQPKGIVEFCHSFYHFRLKIPKNARLAGAGFAAMGSGGARLWGPQASGCGQESQFFRSASMRSVTVSSSMGL
jgi:hypothetical protein